MSRLIIVVVYLWSLTFSSLASKKYIDLQEIYLTDTFSPLPSTGRISMLKRFGNLAQKNGRSYNRVQLQDLRSLPIKDVYQTIQYLPGIYIQNSDFGKGYPLLVVRGFQGSEETDMVALMVDGIQVNEIGNNQAPWNLLPFDYLSTVEVLAGGMSSWYGDGAQGGSISFSTKDRSHRINRFSLNGGTSGYFRGSISHGGKLKKTWYELYTSYEQSRGFREHSKLREAHFGGRVQLPVSDKATLEFQSFNNLSNQQLPGALTNDLFKASPDVSMIYFRADSIRNAQFVQGIEYRQHIDKHTEVSLATIFQARKKDQLRTYLNATPVLDPFTHRFIALYDTSFYGNTFREMEDSDQGKFFFSLRRENPESRHCAGIGAEVGYGAIRHRSFRIFEGFENDYLNFYQTNEQEAFTGSGFRFRTAMYGNGEVYLSDEVKVAGSLRYDFTGDGYRRVSPVNDTTLSKTYQSLNPRVDLVFITGNSDQYEGTITASLSRAYKLPTVKQRVDLKTLSSAIFYPAGPAYQMEISEMPPFSDATLKPQESWNYQLSIHQFFQIGGNLSGEFSLTGYVIEAVNTIEFDHRRMKYFNIAASRHTGVEWVMNIRYQNRITYFSRLNSIMARITKGEYQGKFLRTIPKFFWYHGMEWKTSRGFYASLINFGASGAYLDLENTSLVKPYTVFSSRIGYMRKKVNLFADMENMFKAVYFTTGFNTYGRELVYPAPGREFRIGIQLEL